MSVGSPRCSVRRSPCSRGSSKSLGQHDALVSEDYFERRDPIVRRNVCGLGTEALYTLNATVCVSSWRRVRFGGVAQPRRHDGG